MPVPGKMLSSAVSENRLQRKRYDLLVDSFCRISSKSSESNIKSVGTTSMVLFSLSGSSLNCIIGEPVRESMMLIKSIVSLSNQILKTIGTHLNCIDKLTKEELNLIFLMRYLSSIIFKKECLS